MPKFITVKKAEQEHRQAARYLKSSLVYSSALIGLISLILGYGSLLYLMFKGRPLTELLIDSLILLSSGLVVGLFQAGYQHYLYNTHPDYFADRMRRAELRLSRQLKKLGDPIKVEHPGRWAVPYLYLIGWLAFAGLIVIYTPKLNVLSVVFLPMAGFFNARFFYLKRLIK
ncbi:MAG TPA: hypothetical protein VLY20_07455 [Nitrospiria bacterium]|nr:hypothetical protein [Nitrospiria bacterium]HUK56478.1 hypothetical protein [Nitrospiria bacterium]